MLYEGIRSDKVMSEEKGDVFEGTGLFKVLRF